jgi:lactate dehydrogenase-like 2-hydroxyacid dehydrogenase
MGVTKITETSRRARIYAARRFTLAVEKALFERYDVKLNDADAVLAPDKLATEADQCDYLLVSITEKVTSHVIRQLAPKLKVIATLSVGVDHIDLEAARAAGVAVIYTPNVLSKACAEIALLLMLNAARRGHEANELVRSGRWQGYAPTQLLGMGLDGRRLGILGMGRIGREVATRAASFGMKIHYHNRNRLDPGDESGAVYHPSPDSLLRHSDVFCICLHAGAEVRGFLDARRIRLLPPGAIVINISRGSVVDDGALIAALRSGRVFAAGLDVFDQEPAIDARYRTLPNVFLTPHIGSATTDTRDAMGFLLLDGIRALEEGRPSPNHFC